MISKYTNDNNYTFRGDSSQGQGPQPSPRPNLPHLPPTNNNKSGKKTFSAPENSHFWRKVWVQWPGSHLQWSGSQKWAVVPRGRSSDHIRPATVLLLLLTCSVCGVEFAWWPECSVNCQMINVQLCSVQNVYFVQCEHCEQCGNCFAVFNAEVGACCASFHNLGIVGGILAFIRFKWERLPWPRC